MPLSALSIPSLPRQSITFNLISSALSATSLSTLRPDQSSPQLHLSLLSIVSRMLFSRIPILFLTAVLLPSVVEAGLFYKSSPVKMLDAKSFKKAMRENVRYDFLRNAVF